MSLRDLMRFPSWFGVIRGRKVEDRGRGVSHSFLLPAPVPTVEQVNRMVDEKFGLTECPECHKKVAVLISGICRDCGPEAC